MSCSFFYYKTPAFFKIHNFWKNHLDIVLVLDCEESYGIEYLY